jgi:hypothetical protein
MEKNKKENHLKLPIQPDQNNATIFFVPHVGLQHQKHEKDVSFRREK